MWSQQIKQISANNGRGRDCDSPTANLFFCSFSRVRISETRGVTCKFRARLAVRVVTFALAFAFCCPRAEKNQRFVKVVMNYGDGVGKVNVGHLGELKVSARNVSHSFVTITSSLSCKWTNKIFAKKCSHFPSTATWKQCIFQYWF